MMFSATMPPAIEELARTLLHDPLRIDITPVAGARQHDGVRAADELPDAVRRARHRRAAGTAVRTDRPLAGDLGVGSAAGAAAAAPVILSRADGEGSPLRNASCPERR